MKKLASQNKNIVDYLVVSGVTIICTLVTFIYNIYVRRYVMPYDFGVYTSANLLLLYMNFLQFGVLNSYGRDYPQLLGGEQLERAAFRKNVVFSYILVLYSIVAIVFSLIIFLLMECNVIENKLGIGLVFNAFLALLTLLYSFFDTSLKSEKKFVYSSVITICKTFVLVSVGFFSVRIWGYFGLFVALGISALVSVAMNINMITKIRLCFDKSLIMDMAKYGLPLLVNSLVWTAMISVDRFIILFFMSMEDLGVYSIALLGFSTLMLIPQSLTQVFYIKMSQKYGESNDVSALISYARKYTEILGIISSIVCIFAYFLLPIFIKFVMPNYVAGIKAAQILVIGVSLYSTTLLYSNILSITKQNATLIKSTIVLCILNIIFSAGLVWFCGKNINYVAAGSSISYGLYAVILIDIIHRKFHTKRKILIKSSLFLVVIALIPCLTIGILVSNSLIGFILSLLICMIIFSILYHKNIIQKFKNVIRVLL